MDNKSQSIDLIYSRRKITRKPLRPKRRVQFENTIEDTPPKPASDALFSFLGSWQLWLACLSALVYMLGYYRALLLFSALGIFITPTEVYDLISLFVWGITTLVATIPMGALATFIGYMMSKTFPFKKAWHLIAIGLFLYLVFRVFYVLLPWLAEFNPPGFIFVPSKVIYNVWYSNISYLWQWNSIALSAIVLVSFVLFSLRDRRIFPVFLVALVGWMFLLTSTQYYDFESAKMGGAINYVSQYPGMNGLLITNSRVAFTGTRFTEFGDNTYGVWGLLLSRHAGEYYFIPWIVANDFKSETVEPEIAYKYGEVVIIPEKNVISFLKRFSDPTDFLGVNPPADQ